MNSPIGEICQRGNRQLALEPIFSVTQLCPMAMPELKRRRKEKKISLETLGQLVDLSTSQVQRFETGERQPRLIDLQAIAAVLECDVNDLIGVTPSPAPPPGPQGGLLPVPLIGKTAAGIFREVIEFDDVDPDYVFEPEDDEFPKARRFALTVEGDSMDRAEPPIPDGARVVCLDFEETGQPYIEGMIVVIERLREGGHLREWSVKQIELHGDEVWFCPRSNSPRHKPIKVPNEPNADVWSTMSVIGLVRDVSLRVRPLLRFRT